MEKKALKIQQISPYFYLLCILCKCWKVKKIFFLACLYYEDYKFHPNCKMLGEKTFFGKNIFERCYEYM